MKLFVNHILSSATLTSEDGSTLLRVPYNPRQSMAVVSSLEGYILTPLPWRASRLPGKRRERFSVVRNLVQV